MCGNKLVTTLSMEREQKNKSKKKSILTLHISIINRRRLASKDGKERR
jgi:hypothetical protein